MASTFLGVMKGKVALVTGASSGIGAATAVEFARLGVKCALLGRNQTRLQETADHCMKAGLAEEEVMTVTGDVTVEEQRTQMVLDVLAKMGTVHYLVNNAGSSAGATSGQACVGGIQDTSVADFNHMLQLHVVAPFHFTKLLTEELIKNKGSIVNVSSENAILPDPDLIAYSVAKSGLSGLTRSTAIELARLGVRCNAVGPTWVKTPFMKTSNAIGTSEEALEYTEGFKHLIPQQHIGDPAEIARLIVFLASDACPLINGKDVFCDGCSTIAGVSTYQPWLQDKIKREKQEKAEAS